MRAMQLRLSFPSINLPEVAGCQPDRFGFAFSHSFSGK